MSGSTQPTPFSAEVQRDFKRLDYSCRRHGVTARMWKTAKFVFYTTTLFVMAYLIEIASVEPFLAMAFAVLLIAGPEGLEAWLVRQGAIAERDSESPSDD